MFATRQRPQLPTQPKSTTQPISATLPKIRYVIIIFVVIIVIFCFMVFSIWFVNKLSSQNESNKPAKSKRSAIRKIKKMPIRQLATQVIGHNDDEVARTLFAQLNNRPRTINERVIFADLLNYNFERQDLAEAEYRNIIEQIFQNPFEGHDYMFDRAENFDFNPVFLNFGRQEVGAAKIEDFMEKNKDLPKVERSEKFFNEMKQTRTDGQNVHDSMLNEEIKAEYQRILAINSAKNYDYPTLPAYIAEYCERYPQKAEAIRNSWAKISANEPFQRLGSNEMDIAHDIWKYINNPDQPNRESLRDAFIDGIADCEEQNLLGKSVVCMNGRISRMFGSMATLDMNDMGNLKTNDIIRNEIFSKASAITQFYLNNPDYQAVALLYNSKVRTPEQDIEVEEFEQNIKNDIDSVLRADYQTLLTPEKLNLYIEEAKMGV